MPTPRTLEVCIASADDAVAAADGGADRLELNAALELGGLTPTAGSLQLVRELVALPVIVMVRPRGAGFRYSSREKALILRDAEQLLALGADGIACGALLADFRVDTHFWAQLVRLAGQRQTVFHRAFDVVDDQPQALAELIDLGTTRVLTSGGQATAPAGAAQIARLRQLATERIEILPASGITAENISALVHATGCDQIHGSFKARQLDAAPGISAAQYPVTDRQRVTAARQALDRA